MADEPSLEEELEKALQGAYNRGFRDGKASARQELAAALGKLGISDLALDDPIVALGLTERPRNCLARARIDTIGDLTRRTARDLLGITNFGHRSLDEVRQKLAVHGFKLMGE